MSKITILAALLMASCIYALPLLAQSTPTPTPASLSSYNWSVSAAPNLAANPPPIGAVTAAVNNLENGGGFDSVCSFGFADLRHTGNLSLVASVGGPGTCGSFTILDRTSSGFQWYDVDSIRDVNDDVNEVVQDINSNGNFELIVGTPLTYYVGASHCFAVYPVIYELIRRTGCSPQISLPTSAPLKRWPI